MKLSDTALIALGNAASRADRMVPRRPKSPPIADINVCRALLKIELLESAPMKPADTDDLVTIKVDGDALGFRITDAGFRAVNLDPPGTTPETADTGADTAPSAPTGDTVAETAGTATEGSNAVPVVPGAAPRTKASLRGAAQAVLDAWETDGNLGAVEASMADLRSALAGRAARSSAAGAARTPRAGTKQETVLAMLRRPNGASGPQIAEATGWNCNTVRGFLAGLKKKGVAVQTLERVRRGDSATGANTSAFTVYGIREAE